jgi:hypothetical protein
VWKKYYAILTFILFSLIWNGIVLITKGLNPYLEYLNFIKNMVYLPYVKEGFPTSILATPYSLISSIITFKYSSLWNFIYYVFIFFLVVIFAFLAYKVRKIPISNRNLILSMALLLPLLITPYALLHDLLLLFPVFILLSIDHEGDKRLLLLAICVYIAMLILPMLGSNIKIALSGLIPTAVLIYWVQRSLRLLSA